MAEAGSPNRDAIAPAFASSSAVAPLDWEVLSMSMSASALGKPQSTGDDTNDLNPHPNPPIESSLVDVSTFETENPNPRSFSNEDFASDIWTDPLLASVSRDDSSDIIAEPFTEGWKPHHSVSSDLYGYSAEHDYGEGNRQEEALLSSQDAGPYVDSSACMAMSEGCFASEKDAGAENSVMSYAHSDDVEFVPTPKSKLRYKGGNPPRKSSRVMWSIAVAATIVGIAFLGHRWRVACHHNEQLQLEISAKDQKLNDLLYQVNRLKEVVGGYQKVPVTRSSSV